MRSFMDGVLEMSTMLVQSLCFHYWGLSRRGIRKSHQGRWVDGTVRKVQHEEDQPVYCTPVTDQKLPELKV